MVYPLCVWIHLCVSMWLLVCWCLRCRWLPAKIRSLPHFRGIWQCRLKRERKRKKGWGVPLASFPAVTVLCSSPGNVCEQCTKASVYFRKEKNKTKKNLKKKLTCQGLSGQSLSTCAWESLVPVEMIHCLTHTDSPRDFPFSLFLIFLHWGLEAFNLLLNY